MRGASKDTKNTLCKAKSKKSGTWLEYPSDPPVV